MRSSKYTREVLAPTGGNYRYINARVRLAQLDTSHFTYGKRSAKRFGTDATLSALVAASTSVAQVLAKLELPTVGRPHRELTRELRRLGIDTRHFRGSGWSRGETKDTHPSVKRAWQKRRLPDDTVFIENGPMMNGPSLVRRLLAMGWRYECAWCEVTEWRGRELVLHLDHINGTPNDHRIENLRLLCPNCHSQTDTYCNRRR